MSNIIALVWDFDKTLVDGYIQNPIFEEKEISSKAKAWHGREFTGTPFVMKP